MTSMSGRRCDGKARSPDRTTSNAAFTSSARERDQGCGASREQTFRVGANGAPPVAYQFPITVFSSPLGARQPHRSGVRLGKCQASRKVYSASPPGAISRWRQMEPTALCWAGSGPKNCSCWATSPMPISPAMPARRWLRRRGQGEEDKGHHGSTTTRNIGFQVAETAFPRSMRNLWLSLVLMSMQPAVPLFGVNAPLRDCPPSG